MLCGRSHWRCGSDRRAAPARQRRRRRQAEPASGDIDLHFAVGDEIHAVADLAAANDGDARRHFDAAQHVGDFGERRRIERLEERNLADQVPGLDEMRRRLSAAKPVARMPVHNPKVAMPQIITNAPIKRPRPVCGTIIAIAGGGERNHRPPQRSAAACRIRRLPVALDHVHDCGGEKQRDQKQHQHAGQRLCLQHEDPPELGKARRILRKLEHPKRSEQPRLSAAAHRRQGRSEPEGAESRSTNMTASADSAAPIVRAAAARCATRSRRRNRQGKATGRR